MTQNHDSSQPVPAVPPGALSGRAALVTGAQQGIGRAVALALAAAGAAVAVNFFDDEAAAADVAARAGNGAVALRGDVGTVSGCAVLVAAAVGALGRLDVLVNNAGIFPRVPFLEMREEDWDRVLGVNLKGTAFCAQAAARAMAAAGRGGSIINLSSSALRGTPVGAHYAASKAGVVGLTRSMALALAPHGVRVNSIAPGLTDTAQPRGGNNEAELDEMARAIPLGRMGTPADVASLAVFLASDASKWMTGQTLHLNGGAYMR